MLSLARNGGTVVEHSPHHRKIEGLSLAATPWHWEMENGENSQLYEFLKIQKKTFFPNFLSQKMEKIAWTLLIKLYL